MKFVIIMNAIFIVLGENCLFMGHSFFAPIVERIPDYISSEFNHTQSVISRGGQNGIPSFLWNSFQTRLQIQQILNQGDVDLLGMAIDRATASNDIDDFRSTEYYELWIDYALDKNPQTKFMIGIPWADFPQEYNTSSYTDTYRDAIPQLSDILTGLYQKYPEVTFITNPYGLGVIELRLLFEEGTLPDVSSVTGQRSNSIFRDTKGHAGTITLDLLTLFFINRIYNVDLTTLDIDLGYQTDLKSVGQSVLDAYDAGNLCGRSSCYSLAYAPTQPPFPSVPHGAPSLPHGVPYSPSTDCHVVKAEYRANRCCAQATKATKASQSCVDLAHMWNTECCAD